MTDKNVNCSTIRMSQALLDNDRLENGKNTTMNVTHTCKYDDRKNVLPQICSWQRKAYT